MYGGAVMKKRQASALYALLVIVVLIPQLALGWPVAGKSSGTSLPDQTGNNGKYLSTDGTTPMWATVSAGGITGSGSTRQIPRFTPPTYLWTENFSGNLSGWTVDGGTYSIVSGELNAVANSGTWDNALWSNSTIAAAATTYTLTFDYTVKSAGTNAGFVFGAQDTNPKLNNYLLVMQGTSYGQMTLYVRIGGGYTSLASKAKTFAADTKYAIKIERNNAAGTIKVYRDSALELTATDITYPTLNKFGPAVDYSVGASNARYDNFALDADVSVAGATELDNSGIRVEMDGTTDIPGSLRLGSMGGLLSGSENLLSVRGTRSIYLGPRGDAWPGAGGGDNINLGFGAGHEITTAVVNFFGGFNAGYYTTIGSYNIGLGDSSLLRCGACYGNVALNHYALSHCAGSNCYYNNASGENSLYTLINGHDNDASGWGAGYWGESLVGCSFKGSNAGVPPGASYNNLSNCHAYGYNAKVRCSNCYALGGTGSDKVNVGVNQDTPASAIQTGTPLDTTLDYMQMDTLNADTAGPPPSGDCDSVTKVGRFILSTRYSTTAEHRLWVCTQTGAASFSWKYASLL